MPELTVSQQIGKGIQSTLEVPAKVVRDPENLQRILKIALNALKYIAVLKGMDAMPMQRFGQTLDDAVEMIDAVQVIPDGIFLSEQKLERKSVCKIGWGACFFTADVMGIGLMLEDYKLFELAKHAAYIGGKQVFLDVLSGVVAAGHAIKIVDIILFDEKDTTWKKIRCGVAIARSITEIAAKTFAIWGPQILLFVGLTAAAPTLIIVVPLTLGILSAGLGVTEFFIKEYKVEKNHGG